MWTANPHPLLIDDAITFDRLTPRCLITTTTTTTMADYMLVLVLQKILSLSGLQWQNILQAHTPHRLLLVVFGFFFYCLFVYSAQALCACSSSPFWWISSVTYKLEYELKCVESFTMDPLGRKYSWNDAEEDGGKRLFWCVWTWSRSLYPPFKLAGR